MSRLFLKFFCHLGFLTHHIVVSIFSAVILLRFKDHTNSEVSNLFVFMPVFATNWNFSFQTTFLCLALAYDVLQWLDKEGSKFGTRLKYLRDIVFNGLVFPFTCFVHFMFWAVYFIDRELVFPTVYDQVLPWWLNHCVHTNIIIVLIVETILTTRRYPTDVKVERIFYVTINILYAVVFYSIFFFAGCWLYGVFGVMNWWQVCIYQCGISFSSYVFYHSAFFFNRLIHAPENSEEITKTNEDIEAKNDKHFDGGLASANEMKIACVENVQFGEGPKAMKNNFVGENGEKLNGDGKVNENGKNDKNGTNDENGKDWKSIQENGTEEENGTFEKSWSTKYRTSRNEFENSSL